MIIYDPIAKALELEPIHIEYNNLSEYIEEEFNDKIIPWNVGIPDTEESKKSKRKKMLKYWTEERKIQKSKSMIAYNEKHGTERYTEALHKKYEDPEFREKHKESSTKANRCVKKRQDASVKLKAKWQDADYVSKMSNRGGGRKKVPVNVNGVLYGSVSEAVAETGLSYHKIRKMAGLVK